MADKETNGQHEFMSRMAKFSQDTKQEGDFLAEISSAVEAEQPKEPQGSLGQRVKRFRREKRLSLAELAQSSGISPEELADIEADRANPPLGILSKLGRALGMRFGSLISGGQLRDYVITRQSELIDVSHLTGPRQTSYGYTYHSLAAQKKNRAMEPFLITLRTPKSEVTPEAHGGEEFIFVLQGEMEAVIGQSSEILGPGDSIYYDSQVPHLVRPAGDSPTQILAVLFSPQD